MSRDGYLPPGIEQRDIDAYYQGDEPPQEWHECDACGGEGQVFDRMSHGVCSGTIDPPFEIYEACGKCNGDGGWLDDRKPDSESDHCPYRHFTAEEEEAWERVFEGLS